VKRLFAAAMLLALAAAVPVRIAAQEPDPPSYSESAGAEYVMLPVLVTDKDGKYVEGLTKDDFVIRVGDSRVDFDTFERYPVSGKHEARSADRLPVVTSDHVGRQVRRGHKLAVLENGSALDHIS